MWMTAKERAYEATLGDTSQPNMDESAVRDVLLADRAAVLERLDKSGLLRPHHPQCEENNHGECTCWRRDAVDEILERTNDNR